MKLSKFEEIRSIAIINAKIQCMIKLQGIVILINELDQTEN